MASGVIVGIVDYSNNTYILLNLTCPDNPVLSRTRYPDPPILFTLVPSENTHTCPVCNTANLPPPSDPSTEDTTRPSDIVSDKEPPVSVGTPVGLDDNSNHRTTLIGATSASIVVVVLLLIVTVVMVIVAFKFVTR